MSSKALDRYKQSGKTTAASTEVSDSIESTEVADSIKSTESDAGRTQLDLSAKEALSKQNDTETELGEGAETNDLEKEIMLSINTKKEDYSVQEVKLRKMDYECGPTNVFDHRYMFLCKVCGKVENVSLRWQHKKCAASLQSEETVSASEAGSDSEMQRKASVPQRMDPQILDDGKKMGIFIKAKLRKYLHGKSKSVPNATAICENMSRIRETFLRKDTMAGGTVELLKMSIPNSTYSIELPPEPPLEVKTVVLYTSHYSNVLKVYWRPPEKDHLIDGYKVMTSDNGEVWHLGRVVNRRKHCTIGLKSGLKIGVCSYKGEQDSRVIESEYVEKKPLAAGSLEQYEASSFIDLRMNSCIVKACTEEHIGIPKCHVKMVPLMLHKVLCTPLKLTPLSLGLRCLAEAEERSQSASRRNTSANSAKSIKYCFCIEEDLVSLILNSKDPSFDTFGIQVLVRFCLYDQSNIQEDKIPDCIVRINHEIALLQVKDKHCGPLDITHLCSFTEGKGSKDCLSVEWMPSRKKSYCVTICVAEKLTIPGIVSNLMMYNLNDCSTTKDMVMNKFENDKDVSCTGLKASLICPLGKTRLVSPCRGSDCTHIQCMDALTLLKMNEGRPLSKNKCYMCDEPVGNIYIDGLFLEILSSVPDSVTEIEFKQDGSWMYEENGTYHTAKTSSPIKNKEQTSPLCDVDTRSNSTTSHKESEREEDIFGAMKSHLSRLQSQVDKLEYLSKQHESFKEKIDDSVATSEGGNNAVVDLLDKEGPNLVDLTRGSNQGLSDQAGCYIEDVKKIVIYDNVKNDKDGDSVVVDLLDGKVQDYVDLTCDDEQKMPNPTDNTRIRSKKKNGKKNKTEKKIDNMIAKMLKSLKKSEEKSVREKEDMSNDDTESDVPFVVIENDLDTVNEDDIVEIDLSNRTLKIVEDSDDIIRSYKEDGTSADAEISLSGNCHVANLVLPSADKPTENQDNDESDAIGEGQNPQLKSYSRSDNIEKNLNVVTKCEKDLLQKDTDKETARKLNTVQHSRAESESSVKPNSQKSTGTEFRCDNDGNTSKTETERKIDKMSTFEDEIHHSKARKNYSILKLDGTLDEPEQRFGKDMLLPSVALKEEQIDPKLTDGNIEIHTEKDDTGIYGEQIDIESGNLETDQSIGCIKPEIDPNREQEHSYCKRTPTELRLNCVRTGEGTSTSNPGVGVSLSQTDCEIGCMEPGRRKRTKKSDDEPVMPKSRHMKKIKRKLIVDKRKELPEEHLMHQILFDSAMVKKEIDFAPSTKELMKIAESGIKRKLERSSPGPDLEDVLRRPCLPLRSSRLQRFCEKKFCTNGTDTSLSRGNIAETFVKSEVEAEEPCLRETDTSLSRENIAETFVKSEVEAEEPCLKETDTSLSRENIAETFVKSEVEEEEPCLRETDKKKSCLSMNDIAKTDGKSEKIVEKSHLGKKDITITDGKMKKEKGLSKLYFSKKNIPDTLVKNEMDTEKYCRSIRVLEETLNEIIPKDADHSHRNREDSAKRETYTNPGKQCKDTDDPSKADDAVDNRTGSVTEASKKYGEPSSTIEQKPTENTCSSTRSKKQEGGLALQGNWEDDLAKVIKHLTEHGFMSSDMVDSIAKEILSRCGHTDEVNATFNLIARLKQNFNKNHPEIAKLIHDNTVISEKGGGFEEYTSRWFASLKRILSEYGIKNMPDRIYSCDRFRMKPGGFVNTWYKRTTQDIAASYNAYAQVCICSDGRVLPPVVTFKGKLLGKSDHRETFLEWFKTCFLPNCGQARPVCLLMTYRTNQLTLELIETAIENNVVLIGLPLLAVSVLQPLEARIFESLKALIQSKCCPSDTEFAIRDTRFSVVLSDVIKQITPSTVKEAFRATGICPLGKAAKRVDKMLLCHQQCSDNEKKVSSPEDNLKARSSGSKEKGINQLCSNVKAALETVIKIEGDPVVSKLDGHSRRTRLNYRVELQQLSEGPISCLISKRKMDLEQFTKSSGRITQADSKSDKNEEGYRRSSKTMLSGAKRKKQITTRSKVVPEHPEQLFHKSPNITGASSKTELDTEQSCSGANKVTQIVTKSELDTQQADLSRKVFEERDDANSKMDCHNRENLIEDNQKQSILVQGNLQPQRTSSRAGRQLRKNLRTCSLDKLACKQENLNIHSGKVVQKSLKIKFADVNQNPIVSLKRKREWDINGHNIYV
ncbi:uncharacterized protein LOC123561573 isoform X2 [Mercenaria mercenaria]|uniref:uncharacterized protein LOC123561573 isoform X2 n=1 Tax=Mercenaria mercenaria TaxID=6596 RepID=UPI00234EE4CF|nr:uncharacterized protein LOC123561573 isoform X2 [Mercenaria mercenaria]